MRQYDEYYGGFAPYVTVAERRRMAARKIAALRKNGQAVNPVLIEGRTIARTFWGKAWCANLEAYSDFSNRLPRGRAYVRNGSVIDLQIAKGEISALVSGSSIYAVKISIRALERSRWQAVLGHCSGQIDSLVELLQGTFSRAVMEIITCRERGLFPAPKQIALDCSCPDGAVMCKHVAAVLYAVGARLDESPELFFHLRNVDHSELIAAAGSSTGVGRNAKPDKLLKSADLAGIFGIDLGMPGTDDEIVAKPAPPSKKDAAKRSVAKSPVAKPPAAKSPVGKAPVAKSPVAKSPVAKSPAAKRPAAKKAKPGKRGNRRTEGRSPNGAAGRVR